MDDKTGRLENLPHVCRIRLSITSSNAQSQAIEPVHPMFLVKAAISLFFHVVLRQPRETVTGGNRISICLFAPVSAWKG